MGKEANVNICLIDGIDNKKLVIICKKIYFYCCYIRTDEKRDIRNTEIMEKQ